MLNNVQTDRTNTKNRTCHKFENMLLFKVVGRCLTFLHLSNGAVAEMQKSQTPSNPPQKKNNKKKIKEKDKKKKNKKNKKNPA